MSRIGKLPIQVVAGVKVEVSGLFIKVQGPKGSIEKEFYGPILIEYKDSQIVVKPLNNSTEAKSMWGTARSIINGMVVGVKDGFRKELEVNGVGYRASVKGNYINLTLGKSHNTKIQIPEGIKVETPNQTLIILESYDKHKIGQYVATIRSQRPPEPYKGKGIRLKGEYVQRKEGKKS